MWNFCDVSMTVTTGNIAMNAAEVTLFVNIIIMSFAIFINTTHEPVTMAHEAIFFIRRFSGQAARYEDE
jgi:hypothetical protein